MSGLADCSIPAVQRLVQVWADLCTSIVERYTNNASLDGTEDLRAVMRRKSSKAGREEISVADFPTKGWNVLASAARGLRTRNSLRRAIDKAHSSFSAWRWEIPSDSNSSREWFLRTSDELVTGLMVGNVLYQWRRPFKGEYRQSSNGCEYTMQGFAPAIRGKGLTEEEAVESWVGEFHSLFQRLWRHHGTGFKAKEDVKLWSGLKASVDIELYSGSESVTLKQVGCIMGADTLTRSVRWIGDDEDEYVSLGSTPGGFAGYEVGEWFNAIVERDPDTWELVEISHCDVLPREPDLSEEEMEALLTARPGTTSLGRPLE